MNMPSIHFVARDNELKVFRTLLESERPQSPVLYLQGGGGSGKTKLIEQFQTICSEYQTPFSQIVDFYDTDNQLTAGLMNRISAELSAMYPEPDDGDAHLHPFALYKEAFERAQTTRELDTDSEQVRSYERKAEEQFLTDYNEVVNWFAAKGKRAVLFFDTFDAVQDFGDVNRWFLNVFVPILKNTIVVFAGRYSLPEGILFTPLVLSVESFSLAEAENYFHARDIQSDELEVASSIQQIHSLTEGNPLLITLVADWLLEHPKQDLRELLGSAGQIGPDEKRQFLQRLIGGVLRLEFPNEYETVWHMSHIYHRFNADILARVTGRSLDESAAIIANLSQFPFVKYRPQSRSYQLHDVMRDLVREYVLDQEEDKNRELRRASSDKMIEYYDQEIQELAAANRQHDFNVMRAEQLYHYFYIDANDGFTRFQKLVEDADKLEDIPFSDLLLGNAKWYYQDFDPKQKAVYDVYKGWLAKRLGKPAVAEQILCQSLDTLKDLNDPLADTVASSLGHTYKELGRFDDARRIYIEALGLNERSTKDHQERRKIGAQILNNLGNLSRLQGLVHEAHQYSISSLILRQRIDDPEGLANSYYVLALILREFGDNNGALKYSDKAELEYAKLKSDASRWKGIANVTRIRAYICNHVREHDKAIEFATESYRILSEEVGTPSTDLADALDMLGRLIRDKAVDEYQNSDGSDEKLALARRNDAFQLAEQHIERGYLMAQKVEDKFKEAESILSYVRLFYVRGDYQNSLDWYNVGIEICRPRDYFLLLSYYESFAGSNYFALGEYDKAFDRFAWRALYASRCRAMELGMTMDSIASYLERLENPRLISKYANRLIRIWKKEQKDWPLKKHFPQIVKLCEDIKRFASL